ncbi:amphi-Trp domain-containing protein [Catenovulum sediminis]|uniref:Amphi-Trp domain-containing protein n=1 Tax=Catenovulum sediminis TaxID=1740262 RepID=A0ABV1RDN5_9ALTE|nr:amphi-Trp domain-containing protein [Catenovulum sediminis]
MDKKNTNFHYASLHDTNSLIEILESITEGLKTGTLEFSDEESKIQLKPEGLMQLKLSASKDNNKNKFNLKVSWQQPTDLTTKGPLKIQSKKV